VRLVLEPHSLRECLRKYQHREKTAGWESLLEILPVAVAVLVPLAQTPRRRRLATAESAERPPSRA
jgi:hypothetical protein